METTMEADPSPACRYTVLHTKWIHDITCIRMGIAPCKAGFSDSALKLAWHAPWKVYFGCLQWHLSLNPGIFTNILPTLWDEETLVLAIYIRRGQTDVENPLNAPRGQHPPLPFINTTSVRQRAEEYLNCALSLEVQNLLRLYIESTSKKSISRVAWMLVTDSPDLKQSIHESFDGKDANARIPSDQQKWPLQVISRTIVFTDSHGTHTRAKGNPSTVDFAEALVDWYVLGESDVVIANHASFSFGATAAIRTARPLYASSTCSKKILVCDASKGTP